MTKKSRSNRKVRVDSGIVLSDGSALTYEVPAELAQGHAISVSPKVAPDIYAPGETTLAERVAMRRGVRC